MQVILFETVPNLGVRGQICEVAAGYYRNFLSPKGLAVEATKANVRKLQDKIKKLEREAEVERQEARSDAEKIDELRLSFTLKAGEEGKLFGSVTNAMIADALAEKGFEIDRHNITLLEPIKRVGEFPVLVKLHHEINAQPTIIVEAELTEAELEKQKELEAQQAEEANLAGAGLPEEPAAEEAAPAAEESATPEA